MEISHRIHRFGTETPLLNKVARTSFGHRCFHMAQSGLRLYRDMTSPGGRFGWNSTDELADEAVRRGAMQKQAELTGLLDLLKDRPPKNLLEIGAGKGGMIFALSHIAMDYARMVSVDLPGGDYGGGYSRREQRKIESYALPTQDLQLLRADSHEVGTRDRVAEILDGEALDFLMIDGDHSLEGVQSDWDMYAPLVGSGGVVAFHDVVPHDPVLRCEVYDFWQDIKARESDTLEIIEPDGGDTAKQWGGIGVVFVK